MRTLDIFLNLQGSWLYKRNLISRFSEVQLGFVEGQVIFTLIKKNVLLYREKGELCHPLGQKIKAHREYLYIYNLETDEIEKHFSNNGVDTGLFYVLKFSATTQNTCATNATGNHLCNRDIYQAKYKFLTDDSAAFFSKFKLVYDVTGPDKNYISTTEYEKGEWGQI